MSGALAPVEQPLDAELLEAALAAREQAWAPYSGYRVGAALRSADGTVFTGCNVEVASFSHTCCAERIAVFKAVSEGHRDLRAVAIATADDPPATPCGACRQVLREFCEDMPVWLVNPEGRVLSAMLSDLLPGAFSAERLLPHLKARHGGD